MGIQSKAHEALLTVAAMANPYCQHPRKRLRKMRRVLEGDNIDRLHLAQVCLDEVGREQASPRRRAAWRKATKKLARELQRRHQAGR